MKTCAYCSLVLDDHAFECPKCHKSLFGAAPQSTKASPTIASMHAEKMGRVGSTTSSTKNPAIEELIRVFRDENAQEDARQNASDSLEKLGEAALSPLITVLRDKEWRNRWNASVALGRIGSKRAVGPLIEMLHNDEDDDARRGAINALGQLSDRRAAAPLFTAHLKDKDSWARSSAEEALLELGQLAVDFLIGALRDNDPHVRWSAADLLGKIRDPRAVVPLVDALKDKSWQRWIAAWALGEIGDLRAVKTLVASLFTLDGEVRGSIARALRKMSWRKVVRGLF